MRQATRSPSLGQYDMPNCPDHPIFPLVLKLPALNGLFLGQYNAQNGSILPLLSRAQEKIFIF
jgi:hypothetical protein